MPRNDEPPGHSGAGRRHFMAAAGNDPWVSVSTLGEHAFCPRAGILSHEKPKEDTGEEPQTKGRGKRRHFYTLAAWRRHIALLILPSLVLLPICVRMFSSLGFDSPLMLAMHAGNILAGLALAWRLLAGLVETVGYLLALAARARVPIDKFPDMKIPANWWNFIHAGFDPRCLKEGLRDEELRLAGKPFRLLKRGDLHIPVLRVRLPKSQTLYPQHFARIAAYCRLVEHSMGGKAPYGFVMFMGGHRGFIVPCNPDNEQVFHATLAGLRNNVRRKKEHSGWTPGPPYNLGKCSFCPCALRDYDDKRVAVSADSACGSRFRWSPPAGRY